jgi:hypothetical protein
VLDRKRGERQIVLKAQLRVGQTKGREVNPVREAAVVQGRRRLGKRRQSLRRRVCVLDLPEEPTELSVANHRQVQVGGRARAGRRSSWSSVGQDRRWTWPVV